MKASQIRGAGIQLIKINMKYCLLLILLFGLTACYEDPDVVLHQPGVYKGKVDLHTQTSEQRQAILAKRFGQVQTDR